MIDRRAAARRDATPSSHTIAAPHRWLIRTITNALLVAATLVTVRPAASQPAAEPEYPAPVGFVNDRANLLSEPTRAKLEAFLDQVKEKTGAEFAVLTMTTTAPLSPDEYKVEVFKRWGLGQKGKDNGLLMLVAKDERQVKFETGYGLEGALPDGLQSRIFREEMMPRFRAGDYDEGVVAGVLACAQRIAAEQNVTLEWDGRELRYDSGRSSRLGARIAPLALFIGFIILFSILRGIGGGGYGGRRRRGGWYIGPGLGGWGGGFGGFGGGGGGGGFGGGSFGGFGGGSSGGGGGGGSW